MTLEVSVAILAALVLGFAVAATHAAKQHAEAERKHAASLHKLGELIAGMTGVQTQTVNALQSLVEILVRKP